VRRWPADRVAKIAIGVQLLVLIRLPLECLRLAHVHGGLLTWPMIAHLHPRRADHRSVHCDCSDLLFRGRHTLTSWTAAANVAVLVVYKFALM
jgi:hypothetical protein